MAVEVAVVQSTAPTSIGSKNFTSSGFGTPTAAIIVQTLAYSGANPAGGAGISIGFVDCAADLQNCMGMGAVDNQASAETDRRTSILRCVGIPYDSGVLLVSVDFTGTTTDGITLDYKAVSGNADYVSVYLIKGTTNVHTGNTQLTSTSVDVTAPGFKPHLVLVTCVGNANEEVTGPAGILTFGATHNNSSDVVSSAAIYVGSKDSGGTDVSNHMVRNDAATGQLYNNSNAWHAECTAFDASGFTFTANTNTGSDYVHYLALEGDDADDFYVGTFAVPTSTGTEAYTGVGFEPQAMILGQTGAVAVNTVYTSGAAVAAFAIGMTDGTNEYSQGIAMEDAAADMNTQSDAATAACVQLYDADGVATSYVATLTSFDSDGFTLNYSDAPASARQGIAIAMSPAAAAGGFVPYPNPRYGMAGGMQTQNGGMQ